MTKHIFHGGCHGCTQQEKMGVDFCVTCMYFLPDWNLPNRNNKPMTETDHVKKDLIQKYELK
jgi:hypothetical protein